MRSAPIGTLLERVQTWNPANEPGSKFNYIDLSAVDNANKVITGTVRVSGANAPSRARQLVATGDVLVSTVRPNLNAVAVVPPSLCGATASTGFTVLRPTPKVDGRYLFHWVRSPAFVSDMVRKATGASYPAVSDRIIKNSLVLTPSLDEQRRIAGILDQADAIRAKRRQVLDHLDSLAQVIFTGMFEGAQHETLPAGKLMPQMRNGLSPATAGTHAADVLTLSAVTRGSFDESAFKPGTFATEPPADKRVSSADFLMCRGNGNKKLVGVGAYSAEDLPGLVFPDTVIAGTVDTSVVTMEFLSAVWRRQPVRSQIEQVARTTNGTFKVNQKTLSSIRVEVPPLELQIEFGARLNDVVGSRQHVRRALASDDELFASLQHRAFRGEL